MKQRPRRIPATKFVSGGIHVNTCIENFVNAQDVAAVAVDIVKPKQELPEEPMIKDIELTEQEKLQKQQQQQIQEVLMKNMSGDDSNDGGVIDENGKPQFKKIFRQRKKASVRAKEKRIRQNRQLRKAIVPKNALMALNEVKGIIISDFIVHSVTGGFVAIVTVNSNQYEGKGNSKTAAKNNACEQALRDYVLVRMRQKPRINKSIAGSNEAMDVTENIAEETESNAGNGDAEDVPMINLASFALFKLFSEWENEGFEIPELHPSARGTSINGDAAAASAVPKEPKKATIRQELPPNWEAEHPATLLCLMRPGLTYIDCGTIGEKPFVLQNVSVIVDEQQFFGSGRSKKLARRNAAVTVCNELFGTNYKKDE